MKLKEHEMHELRLRARKAADEYLADVSKEDLQITASLINHVFTLHQVGIVSTQRRSDACLTACVMAIPVLMVGTLLGDIPFWLYFALTYCIGTASFLAVIYWGASVQAKNRLVWLQILKTAITERVQWRLSQLS